MISIREVFLTDDIKSIDTITDSERMNLNVYLLDHFGFAFKDIYSEEFNDALKNAIMHSKKSIDIPIHIKKTINRNRDSYAEAVIFQKV